MMMLICLSCILQELTHIPQPLTALQTPLKEGGNFPFQVGLLQELTHIPQPLTALQTPLKKGGNFPFQVGLEEKNK